MEKTNNIERKNKKKYIKKKWIKTYKLNGPKAIKNNGPKAIKNKYNGPSKFILVDTRSRDIIVPPTKFLLGGNISDPLNLNSLQDEALVSISAVTPKSSPIPTPPKVEVIIPPNIYDPLHLLDPVDSIEYEKQLVSPIKSRRLNRQRSRKKKIKEEIDSNDLTKSDAKDEEAPVETNAESANVIIEDNTRKRKSSECVLERKKMLHKDKIVSPVIPQPGAWKRPPKVQLGAPRNRNRTTSSSDTDDYIPDEKAIDYIPDTPNVTRIKTESNNYQFGNFLGNYCGLRTLLSFSDVRLTVFLRHAYLFKDKDILDIGCNEGHMTISVARKLLPKSIVGIDIDKKLISRARKNLSHFQRISEKDSKKTKKRDFFPLSFSTCFGSLPVLNQKLESNSDSLADENTSSCSFPENVCFRTFNYAVTDESQMTSDKQQYDLILCLSLTKWIHLNFGDIGLKMTFRRMFNQLRPGGKLILEAQNWASYKKRKKMTVSDYLIWINLNYK